MKSNKMNVHKKRIISGVAAILTAVLSTSAMAENIGMCTHMAHPHTGNTISGVLGAIGDIGSNYIRDELRWGWGMQSNVSAPLQMPTAYWVDEAEKAGVKSLVILGFGNTAFAESDVKVPTIDDEEYFNKFLEYVRYVVKNCKGKVEAYEIWNEPNHGPFNYQIANKLDYEPADYAELVKAVSAIIREEDENAKIVAGAHLLGGTKDSGWMEGLFSAGIGNYIDAFSIHVYTHGKAPEDEMADECYERVEKIMDNYGFGGEIWLTETGYSTATSSNNSTETEQASYAIRTKVLWDNYLKENGRNGEFFWYNLRCGGTDAADREDNYGVIDYSYQPKPAFNSIKLYNELLEDRAFDSLESSGSYHLFIKNHAKYKDDVTGDYTHILYRGKYESGNKLVPLSGNVAYLYDYQGNVINTYTNTNQSITVSLAEEPQIVHCVTYKTSIDNLEYNPEKNICTISGKTNIPNNELTITLTSDIGSVQEEKAVVKDGKFALQFSVEESGEYIVRVGKEELETLGSEYFAEQELSAQKVQIQKPANIGYGISTIYDSKTTNITISGNLTDTKGENAGGILNALVVKSGTDIDDLNISDIVYMDDVKTDNGEFQLEFSVKDSESSKYDLYLRTDASFREMDSFGNKDAGKFVYTFDFEKDFENLQIKASLTSTESEKAVVIISQYDESGRLLDTGFSEIVANSKTETFTVKKNALAKTYRAYMWDSLTGMKPIVPMTEIK